MWLNTKDMINYVQEHIENDAPLNQESAEAILQKLRLLQGYELLQQIIDVESYKEYWDWSVADIVDENRELKEFIRNMHEED